MALGMHKPAHDPEIMDFAWIAPVFPAFFRSHPEENSPPQGRALRPQRSQPAGG